MDYYPAYGLDRDAGFRPLKSLAEVIEIFTSDKDSWGMAYWFRSPNSFLGAKRPQDLLGTQPELVIAAAQDEIQEICHG
ncbi:antitoxin Xre/MbcA/ParS toxin-binding domain-containing protein [Sodalis ligni]|uniref:antitoxin Xre/MbcA/ParS toxin-binding domain-containing protein n=1 Tax=Sodalis ligni TaxID=2697027 RepID=UPI002097803C|nr:antitoxin Xre/MbcA/ParS toxin-binding domain-containing protein [Sodalis ligni]